MISLKNKPNTRTSKMDERLQKEMEQEVHRLDPKAKVRVAEKTIEIFSSPLRGRVDKESFEALCGSIPNLQKSTSQLKDTSLKVVVDKDWVKRQVENARGNARLEIGIPFFELYHHSMQYLKKQINKSSPLNTSFTPVT